MVEDNTYLLIKTRSWFGWSVYILFTALLLVIVFTWLVKLSPSFLLTTNDSGNWISVVMVLLAIGCFFVLGRSRQQLQVTEDAIVVWKRKQQVARIPKIEIKAIDIHLKQRPSYMLKGAISNLSSNVKRMVYHPVILTFNSGKTKKVYMFESSVPDFKSLLGQHHYPTPTEKLSWYRNLFIDI